MAVRRFPTDGVARQQFQLQRVDYGAPEANGRRGGVQAGWPLWSATWTLGNLKASTSDAWEALLTSLRGGQRAAFGMDLRRPFPIAHASGFRSMLTISGAPFFGAAESWSDAIDADGDCQLTLETVPAGLILSPIDYIGFKWDAEGSAAGSYDRYALVRVAARAMAGADGTIVVTVEPAVPAVVPSDAVAYLDRPGCLFKLTAETSIAEVDRLLKIKGSKIAAVQVLEP